MKKVWIVSLIALLLTSVLLAGVNVTFRANTAGVPDTLSAASIVQIRGNADDNDNTTDLLSPGVYIAWNANTTMNLTNVGGDYWEGTFQVPDHAQIDYKFFTNPHTSIAPGDAWEHKGWEGNMNFNGGNRLLDLTGFDGTDTTLDLQFVDGFKGNMDPLDKPYTTNDSTFVVWVRVNVQGWKEFDPDTMLIGVRGSNASDWGKTGEICWDTTYVLTKEKNHINSGQSDYQGKYFYSGAIHVPNTYATAGVQFKYVAHYTTHDLFESWNDMLYNTTPQYEVSTTGRDTTIFYTWFDNLKPGGFEGTDSVDVTFYADLSNAIANNGFEIGDTLLVHYGYFNSSDQVYTATMGRQVGAQNYFIQVPKFMVEFGKPLYYQYYVVKSTQEQREVYFNFDYTGDVVAMAERRSITIDSSPVVISDVEDSKVDSRRMPTFKNNTVISQPLKVAVECDVRPAIYQLKAGSTLRDIQSGYTITPLMLETNPDTVFALGVYINGPLSNNGEGTWQTWGGTLNADSTRKMYDDGTHGDLTAGDSVFTIVYQLDPDSNHTVGQEFKFGIGGGDNESGYGLNHIENIDDSSDSTSLQAQWGSINPKFYSAWDYDKQQPASGIQNDQNPVARQFALYQNYPNPFNPETNIRFSIPQRERTTLTIYNTLGQVVRRQIYGYLESGNYLFIWNGTDQNGSAVATGIYFYEVKAGNKYRDIRKMVLIK
jgi:hypothetical protein